MELQATCTLNRVTNSVTIDDASAKLTKPCNGGSTNDRNDSCSASEPAHTASDAFADSHRQAPSKLPGGL